MRLRVVTYNIHKCLGGLDRRYDPQRVREVLARHDPDLALLQEVDEGARRSSRHRQVDLLGEMLGLRHRAFFPNVRVRGGGHYGNALLSRIPFRGAQNIDLSLPPSKRRSVLHAWFRLRRPAPSRRARTVHVYNLHLGLSQFLRRRQLGIFLASRPFASFHPRTPVIVAGDFNDHWGALGRELLAPRGFRGAPQPIRTFPAWAPVRALDSIYVRGDAHLASMSRSDVAAARWASDHLPLVAEIRIR